MRRFFFLFLTISVLLVFGCKDNATGPATGGFGGGTGTGGGTVTFTMGTTAGTQQGTIIFTFKPSAAVTVTTITLKLPAQSFEETLTNPNPSTVFDTGTEYSTDEEWTGVQSGQQWEFVFVGKIGSPTGADYTVTANYTIP